MEEREKRKIIAEEKHKEWVQKKNEQVRRQNAHAHITDLTLAKYLSHYAPLAGFFLLSFSVSDLVFLPTLMDFMKSLSSALCAASLPFPSCGFHLYLFIGSDEACISRSDLLQFWMFICQVSRHLWACKAKTTHFCPFAFDGACLLTPWFLVLVLLPSQSPRHQQNSSVHPTLLFMISLHLSPPWICWCWFIFPYWNVSPIRAAIFPPLFGSLAARWVPDTYQMPQSICWTNEFMFLLDWSCWDHHVSSPSSKYVSLDSSLSSQSRFNNSHLAGERTPLRCLCRVFLRGPFVLCRGFSQAFFWKHSHRTIIAHLLGLLVSLENFERKNVIFILKQVQIFNGFNLYHFKDTQ